MIATSYASWSRRKLCAAIGGVFVTASASSATVSCKTSPGRRFDVHAHVTSDDVRTYPPAPLDGEMPPGAFDDPLTVEKYVALMDQHGIDRAVLVQRAHVYSFDNRYIVDAVDRYRDRLSAICVIDAEAEDSAATVRHWVRDRGAVGIRMTAPGGRRDVDWFASGKAFAAWRAAHEAGASIRLHLYSWNRAAGLPALVALLEKLPEATVVIDHLSGLEVEQGPPDFGIDAALLKLVRFPRVHLMFSMINFRRLATKGHEAGPLLQQLVSHFGASRIMWGSDVGNTAGEYADMIRLAEDATCALSPGDRAMLLHGTAQAVYGTQP